MDLRFSPLLRLVLVAAGCLASCGDGERDSTPGGSASGGGAGGGGAGLGGGGSAGAATPGSTGVGGGATASGTTASGATASGATSGGGGAEAVAPGILKRAEGKLAESGLTVVSYGGYLNGESFQQDAIVS